MKHYLVAIVALTGITLALPVSGRPSPAPAAVQTVIELYQSQGCSSCPPALVVLDQIAARNDVLALNFAVTYWDQLGWKDRFAQPAFTARQWDYSRAQGRSNVQTPQLIVNGRVAALGSDKVQVEATIAANRLRGGPVISINGTNVSVGAATGARPATVWLATYDPRAVAVPIRAGENGGRTLVHRNIVRGLDRIGTWAGRPTNVKIATAPPGMKRAILVQTTNGGPIIAAVRL